MKIIAFSDLHASTRQAAVLVEAAAGADLVIGAGDYCNMRRGLGAALDLLSAITAPMVLVPGNAESADELRVALAGRTMGGACTVLHGSGTGIAGLRLFGLGYGVPPTPFGDWSCDLSEAQAADALAKCDGADILITHSPPKGHCDRTSHGASVGSEAIAAAIDRIQPGLAMCGHIHDSWGQEGRIGATRVVNLGPFANWFEL